jgi:hypothetical protein
LALVHRVCGRQPVSIGTDPLVPDGGHPRQIGRGEKTLTAFLNEFHHDKLQASRFQVSTCNLEPVTCNVQAGEEFIYAACFSSFVLAGSGCRSASELIFFSLSITDIDDRCILRIVPWML